MVTVNGEEINAAGRNLKDFLTNEGYKLDQVVIERNLDIVPLDELAQITMQDDDTIEVLRFVGGG